MNPDASHMDRTWQQLLAAYVDGETTQDERQLVETWLRKNPELNRALQDQQELCPANRALWQTVAPVLPSQEQWQAMLPQIESALFAGVAPKPQNVVRPRHIRRLFWTGLFSVAGLATAAALVLAFTLPWRPHSLPSTPVEEERPEPVYSVATPQDVDIVSVRPADMPHVVVGEPPVPQSMTFVSATDVKVHGLLPDGDGMMPHVQSGENNGMPMVYAPLSRNP
jgi:hypothetical protein